MHRDIKTSDCFPVFCATKKWKYNELRPSVLGDFLKPIFELTLYHIFVHKISGNIMSSGQVSLVIFKSYIPVEPLPHFCAKK